MLWPLLTPSELEISDLANGDSLIQVSSVPENPKVPFAAISLTSIYVINQRPVSIVATHVRSKESLDRFGLNVAVRAPRAGHVFIVQTSKNYLLIYSIYGPNTNKDTKYEVLQVYNQDSDHLIQDVYPVDKNFSFFSFANFTKSDGVNESDADNEYRHDSTKLYDCGLRFRLTLKVSNDLISYHLLPDDHLCILANKKKDDTESSGSNAAVQVLSIRVANEEVKSYFIDELSWFKEDNYKSVKYFSYNEEWNLFFFITNNGNCWVFRSTNLDNVLDLKNSMGYCIYSLGNASQVVANYSFKVILIVTENNDIFYYSLKNFADKRVRLLKKFKKPLNSKQIVRLKFARNEKFMVVLYNNGWCLLSVFGNINFSTFDYDDTLGITGILQNGNGLNGAGTSRNRHALTNYDSDNWLTKIKDIDFFAFDSNLLFINDYGVYTIKLLKWNALDIQSDSSTKKPILYHDSLLFLFKSIDFVNNINSFVQHDTNEALTNGLEDPVLLSNSNSGSNANNNELAACWNILDVPLNKFGLVDPIQVVSVSSDGANVAIYGGGGHDRSKKDKNLFIYSFANNRWDLFSDLYYEYLDVNSNILWWQDEYLFLDNYNHETGKYELLMLNAGRIVNPENHHHDGRGAGDDGQNSNDPHNQSNNAMGSGTNGHGEHNAPGGDSNSNASSLPEFNSKRIIWKYELTSSIKFLNLDQSLNELIILTEDSNLIIFKLKQQTALKKSLTVELRVLRKQVLINLIVKLSLEDLHLNLKNDKKGNFNLIKLSEFSNDLLVLVNGNLYFLNLVKNEHDEKFKYESFLMYNNIEFLNKIDNDSFYFFNGDDILYLNDINLRYEQGQGAQNTTSQSQVLSNEENVAGSGASEQVTPASKSIFGQINSLKSLKISNFDDQFYPIALNSHKEFYIIGLTVDIMSINKQSSKVLRLLNSKKFFLHDLLNFEINKLIDDTKDEGAVKTTTYTADHEYPLSDDDDDHVLEITTKQQQKLNEIYHQYKDSSNFEYSLELLLYMVTTKNNENDSQSNTDFKLRILLHLIKRLDESYLSIVAKCLRKIEIEYWDRIFVQLQQSPKSLLHECIRAEEYKTAGFYLIIFLSYKTNYGAGYLSALSDIGEGEGDDTEYGYGDGYEDGQASDEIDSDDKEEIMNFLKIIVDNLNNAKYNKNNELWDMGIELIRFLKVLDPSAAILQQAISFLERK